MKLHRIYAMILRHLYMMRRNIDKLTDTFYWITLDVFIWGITSVYFQRFSGDFQGVVFTIMSAVILWNMVYRAQVDFSMALLEELWNKNLVNIFVSPITFWEWITSLVILGFTKGVISYTYSAFLIFFLFQVNVLQLSYYIPVFIILLFFSGWTLGFIISGLILRFGTKVQAFAWTVIWIISPLSAIYFPIDVLPTWAQMISRAVPTSYVFEQMRNLLGNGTVDSTKLVICLGLNIVYFSLALIFLRKGFTKVLQKGLVKVY